jgi:hypothetical protein
MDYVDVDEDGSFEFKSLPRTGKMQFIAVCDGWLTADGGGHFITGTRVDVEGLEDGNDQSKQITLQMQKTGSIEVTVVGPDDKPAVTQADEEIFFENNRRTKNYSQPTNEQGVAVIHGIPINHGQSLYVASDEFVLPKQDENDVHRVLNYVCESTEAKKITAKMVKREE